MSKSEPRNQLNLSHRSRRRYSSERGRVQVCIDSPELRRIKNVRSLCPKFERSSVRKRNYLIQRHVENRCGWAAKRISAHISELTCSRNRECRSIEPLRDRG